MGLAVLAVRFIVELIGVGAVAYWGWQSGLDGIGRIAIAVGAAIAFIAVWALVIAPKADNALSQPVRDLIGTALLLVAAGGFAAGEPRLAVLFAAVVVIDWLAMVVLGPSALEAVRPPATARG